MNSVSVSADQSERKSVWRSAILGQRPEVIDKLISWGVQPDGGRLEETELTEAKKIQAQIRSFETAIWFHAGDKRWASKVAEMKAKVEELKNSTQFKTKKEIHQLEAAIVKEDRIDFAEEMEDNLCESEQSHREDPVKTVIFGNHQSIQPGNRELTLQEELNEAKKIQGQIQSFETAIWFHAENKLWASKVIEMKAKIEDLKHSPQFRTKKEIHQLEAAIVKEDHIDFLEEIAVAI